VKAIRVHAFGGPEVLRLEEVPDPQPGPDQVLVRIRAAGVNPVETYVRSGAYARLPELPYIPGSDAAGEVVAPAGPFRAGDRVYVAGAPAYAEMVAAPLEAVWPLPDRLDFAQGAAIGVPYATAHLALHGTARTRPGDWVLVHGASGAVGTAAVQLAVAHGAQVVGTAGSPDGAKLVLEQGARAVVAHADMAGAVAATGGHGFDVIVEMLANVNLGIDLPALAPGGQVVVVGSRGTVEINPRDLMNKGGCVRGLILWSAQPEQRRRVHMALGAGLRNGTLTPVVGRRFPLAEAARAHEAVMAPGALGKIVLTMD
jgi:NADPH2:quinone reductase